MKKKVKRELAWLGMIRDKQDRLRRTNLKIFVLTFQDAQLDWFRIESWTSVTLKKRGDDLSVDKNKQLTVYQSSRKFSVTLIS